MSTHLTRRSFLRSSGAAGAMAVAGSSVFALACDETLYGTLEPPDQNGIRLPPRFRSRLLARSGDPVAHTPHVWHGWPDGGAVFRQKSGWIYVSNSELGNSLGGVSAIRFDAHGEIADAYSILSGTRRNCAGGATPWGSWLSCEEVNRGLVYECDPTGARPAVARPALGTFNHEAVAVDPVTERLYLTEDKIDGGLYRFTPDRQPKLDAGLLEVAEWREDDTLHWHAVPDPNPGAFQVQTRHQVSGSTGFRGGEGIVHDRGHVYFTTKFDNRVWDHDLGAGTLRVLYERRSDPYQVLGGVDNVGATLDGELVVAEDGGNMEIVTVTTAGLALPLLRVVGQAGSELTGPAFSPDGSRLYFSSQRGRDGRGLTYEVSGPFRELLRKEAAPG